jgi:hypothetical protein
MLWILSLLALTALACVLVVYGACCLVSGMSDAMPEDIWQDDLEQERDWHRKRNEFTARQYMAAKGLTGSRADAILWCGRFDCPMTFKEVRL